MSRVNVHWPLESLRFLLRRYSSLYNLLRFSRRAMRNRSANPDRWNGRTG